MANKILEPDLANSNVNYTEIIRSPNVDEGIKKTIAHLMGHNYTTGEFLLVSVDEDGALVVGLSIATSDTLTPTQVDVLVTATQLLGANADREKFKIKNIGLSSIYIGGSNTVTVGNGYLLNPNDEYELDNYVGSLWAIAVLTTCVTNVIEVS